MDLFLGTFCALAVFCALLYVVTRAALPSASDASFYRFQTTYLMVYLLAMAGDWLQGPHVYALYESYKMSTDQIDFLFVAGFGASMVVGTLVGSFADRYGRRANCILYGVLYGLACITKHFGNFWILMLGRLLGGTATSILYSAFESWLVYEHNTRGYDPNLLGNIFSNGVLGNSLVAILAGLVAQKFADYFGFVAPFDVSLTVLVLMVVLIIFSWTENYGDKTSDFKHSFQSSLKAIRSDPKVLCLGLVQSLFEGSMYCFVLEWTPSLSLIRRASSAAADDVTSSNTDPSGKLVHVDIPHGHIFSSFMVCIMIGSSVFKLLCKHTSIESFMRGVLLVSAFSLFIPVCFKGHQILVFASFLIFETCVGIFWPSLGTMRGKYVPEETRATTMNIFRIPLNFIVVLILLQHLSPTSIFECCAFFLLLATLAQHVLYRHYKRLPSSGSLSTDAAKMLGGDAEKRSLHDDMEEEAFNNAVV